jgi:hypothetical protein
LHLYAGFVCSTTAAAVFKATGGQVPRQETKTYIGAGLAVLGVNLVRQTDTVHAEAVIAAVDQHVHTTAAMARA